VCFLAHSSLFPVWRTGWDWDILLLEDIVMCAYWLIIRYFWCRGLVRRYCHWKVHCYKTLRRIPPPGPDGAGPNGQGKGKLMLYMVREIATSGPEVFRNQPKFSEITGNFRRLFQ
jgi:hypothetical protein